VTKTPITPNRSGWVTGTTNEITGPTGFILPGDALGKNGNLSIFARIFGSTTGTKSYRMKIDSTTVVGLGSVGSPTGEYLMAVNAIDSHSVKNCGRLNISVPVGIGYAGSSVVAASTVSVDTSVDTTLSFSLQSSANMCGTILAQTQVIATYGE